MKNYIIILLALLSILTTACSDNHNEDVRGNDMVGKTLNLYSSDGSYRMGIVHNSSGSCTVDLYNGAALSSEYPPTYSYSANGSSVSYTLTFVTQKYVPYYGS